MTASRIPTRGARRRAARLSAGVSTSDPPERATDDAEASEGEYGDDGSESGSARQPGQARASDCGSLAELAALPVVAHPFRLWLVARGISLDRAARAIGVTPRTLHAWLTRAAVPPHWRARSIAIDLLGRDADPDELFPPAPRS